MGGKARLAMSTLALILPRITTPPIICNIFSSS